MKNINNKLQTLKIRYLLNETIDFFDRFVYLRGMETADLLLTGVAVNKKRKELTSMYAVKVLHGYISTNGQRTRDKDCARRFNDMRQAEMFADKIGGRVKELEMNNETRSKQEVL